MKSKRYQFLGKFQINGSNLTKNSTASLGPSHTVVTSEAMFFNNVLNFKVLV